MPERDVNDLDRFWEDIAAGTPPDASGIDPTRADTIRRFHATNDVPGADPAFLDRLLEDLMEAQPVPSSILFSTRSSSLTTNPNGRSVVSSWRPIFPAPPIVGRRRWGLAQFATAALLLVTLGVGYLAVGPLRPGPDQPSSLPAAVAPATPSAAAATPAAATFSRAGHPVIGAWQWDYEPWSPGRNLSYAVFDADGTYVEYHDYPYVSIGTWRATGERTVELVEVRQAPRSLGFMFEPDYAVTQPAVAGNAITAWRTIEIDASGTALTATGYYEPRDGDGGVIARWEFGRSGLPLTATRLAPVPTAVASTPTS